MFYLPTDEQKFIKQTQDAFVRSNQSQIDVLDTVEFEWDRVCGVSKDAYLKNEGKERKKCFLAKILSDRQIIGLNLNRINTIGDLSLLKTKFL